MKHTWRGRYMSRMVSSISKTHSAKVVAKSRLFPYGIVDNIAAAEKLAPPAAPVKPVVPKTVESAPPAKHASWHFIQKK